MNGRDFSPINLTPQSKFIKKKQQQQNCYIVANLQIIFGNWQVICQARDQFWSNKKAVLSRG